jgi:hypothetical protein
MKITLPIITRFVGCASPSSFFSNIAWHLFKRARLNVYIAYV